MGTTGVGEWDHHGGTRSERFRTGRIREANISSSGWLAAPASFAASVQQILRRPSIPSSVSSLLLTMRRRSSSESIQQQQQYILK